MKTADYLDLYVSETNGILQGLEESILNMENGGDRDASIEEMFRNAHNLKGMSGAMGYEFLVEASHALESILDGCKRGLLEVAEAELDLLLRVVDQLGALVRWTIGGKDDGGGEELLGELLVLMSPMSIRVAEEDGSLVRETDQTPDNPELPVVAPGHQYDSKITDSAATGKDSENDFPRQPDGYSNGIKSTRVDLERLDCLMDLVGELIIGRIRLSSLARETGSKALSDELASFERLISEVQKEVMEARLVPAGQVFHRFKRLARDAGRELGKKVDFTLKGSEIGLDRTVLESMTDPLMHLVRNAIDHGVESPAERRAAGKSETASVVLSARRERNQVIIEVSDDGRGIDFERIKKARNAAGARESAGTNLSEEELCGILTKAGFSTRDEVGRYSGRGIGMNVVGKMIDSLGGTLHIDSKSGKGTTISMNLPINLSIIKALLFYVGTEVHALPLEYVKETARIERGSFNTVRGREVYETLVGPIPVVRPGDIFQAKLDADENRYLKVIIVNIGGKKACLVVDRILGQQDVVIKSLPTMVRGASGISGATILGSGKIAFIWDPKVLFYGRSTYESNKEAVVLEN
ncbi:MAG: chemotaxis protein CheA [Candidatus Krumholzibacteria bacterium]|nr:chemotaxis protein CheA [Candidatus Krumholzibacteria bacterium]